MKKIIFAAVISLLASCAKENFVELETAHEKSLSITTRAGSDDWSDDTELVLYDLTNNKNATYTYANGAWSAEEPLGWLSNSIEICGYVAKSGASVDGVVLSEGEYVDQTTAERLTDYDYQYYYSLAIEQSAGGVAIDMDYVLSKVVVNVVTDGVAIEGVSILNTPSSMSFEGGKWCSGDDVINTLACGNSSGSQFSAYVVPSVWESPSITFTNSDGESVTATYATPITLSASKIYTLSVIISDGQSATFDSNFTVENWKNGETLGSYDEYKIDTWDGTVAKDFGGGKGSMNEPYLINTASELAYLASTVNSNSGQKQQFSTKYFKLTTNLDLNGATHIWTPIGYSSATGFGGSFDGCGYSINNMKVDQSATLGATSYDGLFGSMNGSASVHAVVENLTLSGASVTSAGANAGVLCGYIQNYVHFVNCKVEDSQLLSTRTSTPSANVGGIVGQILQQDITIENCHVKRTDIYSSLFYNNMGGVVGKTGTAWKNIIVASSFSGTIDYDSKVVTGGNTISGAIAGATAAEGSSIIGCYTAGSINGKIASCLVGTCKSSITGCYTTAEVSSITRDGALAATLTNTTATADDMVKGCFYTYDDTQAFGQATGVVDNDNYLVEAMTQTQADAMNSAISDYYKGSPAWRFTASTEDADLPFAIEAIETVVE